MTTQSVATDVSWRSRPLLSIGLRLAAYGAPIVAGTVVVRLVSPALNGAMSRLPATLLSLAIAVTVSLIVSRLTMRLMPLVVLLRMTMLFPDKAPSRLKVARRATSMREITKLLASDNLTEHEAAETMLALVTALGRHDRKTRGHSERVRLFCDLLSRELDLPAPDAGRLRWAALIHDIGKLEVAAAVLNKPGSLNAEEWAAIKSHPAKGAALAAPLAAWLGPWFSGIAEHHERFDGTGYPLGLGGSAISMAGRAVAVVDAFETMTAARTYKAARSTFSARAELTRCAGTHFDPMMVRAFLQIALPRLLWSVGPMAFFVNVPFLRWVGEGGARVADVAAATTATAASAAGVTAVAVAVGALPAAGSGQPVGQHQTVVRHYATTADRGTPRSAQVGGPTGTTVQAASGGAVGGVVGSTGATTGTTTTGATGAGSDPTTTPGATTGTGTGSGTGTGTTGSGSAAGGTVGGTVGSVGKTVGSTVGTVGDTVGKTVGSVGSTVGGPVGKTVGDVGDTVGKTVGSVGNTVGKTIGGITGGSGSGSSGSGSSGSSSGSSGSGSNSGSGSSGSNSGSSGSGSGIVGGTVKDTVCNLPLGLCKDSSHKH